MDWKSLGESVAKIGLPLLGAALPLPGGAALGTALASAIGSPSVKPEDIIASLSSSMDALSKAKQFELQHQETILKINIDAEIAQRQADSADIAAVNATMQAESKSERWPQWSWRPYNGFLYGTTILLVYFVLPLFKLPIPAVPESVWMGWGAILGVTAWHRGKMQVEQNKSSS